MGRPKALVDLGGEPALARIVGAYRDAGVGPPLVVVGYDRELVAEAARALGAAVVTNLAPERGQTSSLQEALRRLPPDAEAFFVHPVDAPLVAAWTIRALVSACAGDPRRPAIVLPRHASRRGHPGLFRAAIAPEILALDPSSPASDVIRRDPARVLELDVDDPRVLDRLDTPADVERARHRLEAGDATRPWSS
jgi:CTP:molybdopterin cytidylyltransferase MocA